MSANEKNPIKYVCLSDFHLGADNSILNVKNNNVFEASDVMINLAQCLKSLFPYGKSNDDDDLPTLILNGDIMEFALGKVEDCTMMFERFLELVMREGDETFNSIIRFIPGNHDHHIWENGREEWYKERVRLSKPGMHPVPRHRSDMAFVLKEPDSSPVHWRKKWIKSELLQALIKRHATAHNVSLSSKLQIQLIYPCLAIRSKDQKKCAIIHHGHFTEGIKGPYSLMSHLNNFFSNSKDPSLSNIEELETENFAWIDFLWSTLGRSGAPGITVKKIYKYSSKNHELCNHFNLDDISLKINQEIQGYKYIPKNIRIFFIKKALKRIIYSLEEKISESDEPLNQAGLSQFLHLSWPLIEDDFQLEFVFNWASILKNEKDKINLLDFLVKNFNLNYKKTPSFLVAHDLIEFSKYKDKIIKISIKENGLEKNLELKLEDEEVILELNSGKTIKFIAKNEANEKNIYYKDTSEDINYKSIIYGHTHMPFYRAISLRDMKDGRMPIALDAYNTGGWIVNQKNIEEKFGASVVLMDEALNLVYLQIYREGGIYKEVELKKGLIDKILVESINRETDFYNYIEKAVGDSQKCWTNLINSANMAEEKIRAEFKFS